MQLKRNWKRWFARLFCSLRAIKVVTLALVLILVSVLPCLSPYYAQTASGATAVGGLTVAYKITLVTNDLPTVTVEVSGADTASTAFMFQTWGNALGAFRNRQIPFSTLFSFRSARTPEGVALPWSWSDGTGIVVQNGVANRFVIEYTVNALAFDINLPPVGSSVLVMFRDGGMFFQAGDVLLQPSSTPSAITVEFVLPLGNQVFSTLTRVGESTTFVARRDLWGNLLYDFQKALFVGGKPEVVAQHTTAWGDNYIYVWFPWDGPEVGPWLSPQEYMVLNERLDRYFREHVFGPLPPRTVLFYHGRWGGVMPPTLRTHGNFFHMMQVWSVAPAMALAHHISHAYMVRAYPSKIFLYWTSPYIFLEEGLAMYFEVAVPDLVLGEDHNSGKMFQFLALDHRGLPFGIRNSWTHMRYNVAALQTYLLDQHIRAVTNGRNDLTTFTRALWNAVKDNPAPTQIRDSVVAAAFSTAVEGAGSGYLDRVAALTHFNEADFVALLPAFRRYAAWMTTKFFRGNEAMFLAYLDLAAGRGGRWPHDATAPHMVSFGQHELIRPFVAHLQGLNKSVLTQEDILRGLAAVTGQDHAGFFEYWANLGFVLDPNAFLKGFEHPWTSPAPPAVSLAPPAPPASPRDLVRPTIEVTAPSVTSEATVTLIIDARDNEAVAVVLFDGVALQIIPDATQTIVRTVNLQEGLNSFTLSVIDAAGNVAARIITIDRRIPASIVHTITIGKANPAIGLDVPANVRNGRLMVPFRWFGERILNATVSFQIVGAAEVVTLQRGNLHIELTLNSTVAKVNGEPVALDVAPFATGGRTLVPARFIAETFGFQVAWNPLNDEVTFTAR